MRTTPAPIKGIALLIGLTLTAHSYAQSGAWTEVTPLVTGRAGLQAGAVGGILYAIGGVNGGGTALATEAFDPATGTWIPKAALQPPPGSGGQRSAFASAVVNGTIYVFGGGNGSIFFNDVQAYDPATDTWGVRDPMPMSRAYAVAAALNGKIYLIGGHVGAGGPNAPTLEYDPIADIWIEKAAMPTPRINPGVAVLNGKFYVVGGAATGPAVTTVEVYDPVANVWSTAHSLSTPRMNPAVGAVGGVIYAFGGVNSSWTIVNSGEVYDPATDVWSPAEALPAARTVAGAAALDDVLYVVGGQRSTFPYYRAETFRFTPSSLGFMDTDGDGHGDGADNCPAYANAGQTDTDGDGLGDACDAAPAPSDSDSDGVADSADNCPATANADQADVDGDGVGNACDADNDNDGILDAADNCSAVTNPTQADGDADTIGDACDPDDDNDGVADAVDACPAVPAQTANGCPSVIDALTSAIGALDIGNGDKQALLTSLRAVQASVARGNTIAARGQVGAFINKLQALKRSGRISAVVAAELIAQAQLLL